MAGYYDSSLLLAVLLDQVDPAEIADAWETESIRVSSLLLKIECYIAVRRVARGMTKRQGARWSAARLEAIDEYLHMLTIKPVDSTIEDIIRQDPRLAACRALDAIHLATAIYLQPRLEEPLRICSLDTRLREVAEHLGFEVRPLDLPKPRLR